VILGEQRKEEIEKKTEKESYQVDIQQRCYMDRMTKGLTKNIGDSWCKGTPPFPPLNTMTTLQSYLSLFTSDT